MDALRLELTGALRQARRRPALSALVVLTVGTAIGLATSLFSIYNTYFLRAWPVKDPARVVRVADAQRASGFAPMEWRHLSSRATSVAGLAASAGPDGLGPLEGQRVLYDFVSASYFPLLGIAVHPGRPFHPDEDSREPRPVMVISHQLWQSGFGGDRDIVDRTVQVRDRSFTVIGVAQPGFHGTSLLRIDVWMPLSAKTFFIPPPRVETFLSDPRGCCVTLAARLTPGASSVQARAELQVLSDSFRTAHGVPKSNVVLGDASNLALGLASPRFASEASRSFRLAFIAVGLVLALTCANAGNILLAHAHSRRPEIALRLALGASRARLARQLVTESLVLAGAAAGVGLAAALVIPRVVMKTAPGAHLPFAPDHRVVAFSLLVAVLACLAAALPPALEAARGTFGTALRDGRGAIGTRWTLREGLLAGQVALCVLLLVNAAMLARAVPLAMTRGLDLDPTRMSITHFDSEPSRWRAFGRQLAHELDAPQYAGLAAASALDPLQGMANVTWGLSGDGTAPHRTATVHRVSSGYFAVLKARLVAGRKLVPTDPPARVAVVNEALARSAWPDVHPVGQTLLVQGAPVEVVGVIRDAEVPEVAGVPAAIYQPLKPEMLRFVIMRDDGTGLARHLAAVAARIDPQTRATTMPLAARLDGRTRPLRFGVRLAAVLGLVALTMATFGLFGVFASAVQERTREIGIRLAIGARPAHVFAALFSTTGRAVALGLGVGSLAAATAGWLLRHSLYGLSAVDPVAYLGVAIVITLAGAAATYVPARRALNVDPVVTLRAE